MKTREVEIAEMDALAKLELCDVDVDVHHAIT
jgi:hypothetical protein